MVRTFCLWRVTLSLCLMYVLTLSGSDLPRWAAALEMNWKTGHGFEEGPHAPYDSTTIGTKTRPFSSQGF